MPLVLLEVALGLVACVMTRMDDSGAERAATILDRLAAERRERQASQAEDPAEAGDAVTIDPIARARERWPVDNYPRLSQCPECEEIEGVGQWDLDHNWPLGCRNCRSYKKRMVLIEEPSSAAPPPASPPAAPEPVQDPTGQADGGDEPEGEGAELLDELRAALTRYVVFPSPEAADAVTLWTAASHGLPAWEHAPRLVLVSPERRCGKSRAQDVVSETCHRALITVNASVAAVVRSLSDDPPTLLVDEADTIFGSKKQAENNEDLRGILNAGHQRNRPTIRWDITSRSLEELRTFAMACLASIGALPDTIMDRAVVVRMRRRAPGEQVAPYRTRRDAPPLRELGDRLAFWVRTHLDELEKAVPEMPLEDRAADTWEPLVAVADLAGGAWPVRARRAALLLVQAEGEQGADSLGIRLLADLEEVFADEEKLSTEAVLDRLRKLEEAPWGDWHGRPLTTRDLARLLRPYGVKPKTVRIGDKTPRGYERADLHDTWQRYVPGARNNPNNQNIAGESVADESVYPQQRNKQNTLTSDVAVVAPVADATQDGGLNAQLDLDARQAVLEAWGSP